MTARSGHSGLEASRSSSVRYAFGVILISAR